MGNWADLPTDVVGLILPRLSLVDQIRAGAVCVSWNSACKSRMHPPRSLSSPWLFLPADGLAPNSASIYSPVDRTTLTVPLPLPPIRSRVCIGSSHGWLITLSGTVHVHLLNPLTLVQIPLPPHIRDPLSHCSRYGSPSNVKAILSPPPDDRGLGYTVIIMQTPWLITVLRHGDTSWSPVSRPHPSPSNMIRYKANLYTVSTESLVHVWDEGCERPVMLVGGLRNRRAEEIRLTKYLVESLAGELLMVTREKLHFKETLNFEVMRLDMDTKEWHAVEDLGDDVLFVGTNCSVSISATEFPEFRRNCIYFTQDLSYLSKLTSERGFRDGFRDEGVFDMKRKKMTWLDSDSDFNGHPVSRWPHAIWITPNYKVSELPTLLSKMDIDRQFESLRLGRISMENEHGELICPFCNKHKTWKIKHLRNHAYVIGCSSGHWSSSYRRNHNVLYRFLELEIKKQGDNPSPKS